VTAAHGAPAGGEAAGELRCDACLEVAAWPPTAPWSEVWRRARAAGWRGSDLPDGWHRCPGCADWR
jgi:hypothetical protein